jgi:hypothetical protein
MRLRWRGDHRPHPELGDGGVSPTPCAMSKPICMKTLPVVNIMTVKWHKQRTRNGGDITPSSCGHSALHESHRCVNFSTKPFHCGASRGQMSPRAVCSPTLGKSVRQPNISTVPMSGFLQKAARRLWQAKPNSVTVCSPGGDNCMGSSKIHMKFQSIDGCGTTVGISPCFQ